MAGEIHLWLRASGAPKALAAGSRPPGPGLVVAVVARSVPQALERWTRRNVLLRERLKLAAPEQAELTEAQRLAVETWSDEDRDHVLGVRRVPAHELVRNYGEGA